MAEGKKNNEVKIGLLALGAIVALFLGFNFLKGNSLFDKDKEYYAYYENVEGLTTGSKVLVNGYKIGKVADIEMTEDQRFKVKITVIDDFKVPVGSLLQVTSSGLLSEVKNLELIAGKSAQLAPEGAVLKTLAGSGMMDQLSENMPSVINNVNSVMANADTLMANLKGVVTPSTGQHIDQSVAALEITMKQLEVLSRALSQQSGTIAMVMENANMTMKNTNALTANLANNNAKINAILDNAQVATNQFSQAKIQQTIDNLEATTNKLNGLMTKLDNKDGTVGMLLNDPKLYENVNKTVKELGELSADLKAHPSRYINISVFPSKARKD
ncbi:mce related protein [compost metagenome]